MLGKARRRHRPNSIIELQNVYAPTNPFIGLRKLLFSQSVSQPQSGVGLCLGAQRGVCLGAQSGVFLGGPEWCIPRGPECCMLRGPEWCVLRGPEWCMPIGSEEPKKTAFPSGGTCPVGPLLTSLPISLMTWWSNEGLVVMGGDPGGLICVLPPPAIFLTGWRQWQCRPPPLNDCRPPDFVCSTSQIIDITSLCCSITDNLISLFRSYYCF